MIGANGDTIFSRLAQAMGQPELAEDERYATHVARGIHQENLDTIISAWTSRHMIEAIDALMTEHSIPAGRVYTAPDMLNDPHFKAREAIIEVETEKYGKLKMQNAFPKLILLACQCPAILPIALIIARKHSTGLKRKG